MAHNNGSGFRALGPGMSEASAQFRGPVAPIAGAMTGAELAGFVPHRPARPEKSEGGRRFQLVSEYEPAGDQPTAIAELTAGLGPVANSGERDLVLLGVTGSGKTFTMAKVIQALQRPALILAPNKTLAAQLFSEMKSFFPENAVEYFVSYYDYYQPEAYVPRTDTYIEKDSSVNEEIDRMRHSATRAILERDDVIIVASVSCIYGIGAVETYSGTAVAVKQKQRIDRSELIQNLVALQYKRNDDNFVRGAFRARGDTIDVFPAHYEDRAWRIELFGDEVEFDRRVRSADGKKIGGARSGEDLRQFALCDAQADAGPGGQGYPRGIARAARLVARQWQAARGAAAGAAHAVRSRNDRGDGLLRRHRELFALAHGAKARRAAADPVRISARRSARLRRRKPCDGAADRRHVSRRLPPQGDARRIWLPAAVLHRQSSPQIRGMGRDATADRLRLGNARTIGRWSAPAASSPNR